jgi:hypothetical protein
MEGKTAEAFGVVEDDGAAREFRMKLPKTRLVMLEDQLGRDVQLRGLARSLNGQWWFVYRGRTVYVDFSNPAKGWTTNDHWRPCVVRGRLGRALRPDPIAVVTEVDPQPEQHFVVQDASWEPVDALLGPERVEEDD